MYNNNFKYIQKLVCYITIVSRYIRYRFYKMYFLQRFIRNECSILSLYIYQSMCYILFTYGYHYSLFNMVYVMFV